MTKDERKIEREETTNIEIRKSTRNRLKLAAAELTHRDKRLVDGHDPTINRLIDKVLGPGFGR